MHANPYAANLANAKALESGLLWLMLTAICLRFLIYGILPFTLARDRAAAANLKPCSPIGAAAADLDAAAGAPDQTHTADDREGPKHVEVKLRASTELAAAEVGQWRGLGMAGSELPDSGVTAATRASHGALTRPGKELK